MDTRTSTDLSILQLADALDALARHNAHMAPNEIHPACLECATTKLLMRVVVAGRHVALVEQQCGIVRR